MAEKRKFKRYALEVPSIIESEADTEAKTKLSLTAANVCAGGAYFPTPHALAEGTNVNIEMILTISGLKIFKEVKKSLVLVPGTVIRSEKGGMAIRFGEDYQITPLSA